MYMLWPLPTSNLISWNLSCTFCLSNPQMFKPVPALELVCNAETSFLSLGVSSDSLP